MSISEIVFNEIAPAWFRMLLCSIWRLNPPIPTRALATRRNTLLPKLLSGELSVH